MRRQSQPRRNFVNWRYIVIRFRFAKKKTPDRKGGRIFVYYQRQTQVWENCYLLRVYTGNFRLFVQVYDEKLLKVVKGINLLPALFIAFITKISGCGVIESFICTIYIFFWTTLKFFYLTQLFATLVATLPILTIVNTVIRC